MPEPIPNPLPQTDSACAPADCAADASHLEVADLSVHAGSIPILRAISLTVPRGQIFGLVGPSGAGKSTLLRSINRLLDLQPEFRVSGSVRLAGTEIYAPCTDPDSLRARIGMLFQQPVIFPSSIARNVLFGARHHRKLNRGERANLIESTLRDAALWDEVKDRLGESALRLSTGQQQRLCLARALAIEPEIILMDEPTSALDSRSTEAIEQLILGLRGKCTIVLVTHNLEQARRITDWVGCLCRKDGAGEMLESACCDAFFSSPACREVFDLLGPAE